MHRQRWLGDEPGSRDTWHRLNPYIILSGRWTVCFGLHWLWFRTSAPCGTSGVPTGKGDGGRSFAWLCGNKLGCTDLCSLHTNLHAHSRWHWPNQISNQRIRLELVLHEKYKYMHATQGYRVINSGRDAIIYVIRVEHNFEHLSH